MFNQDIMQNVEFCFCLAHEFNVALYNNFNLPYYIVVDYNNIIREIGTEINLELAVTDILINKPLVLKASDSEISRISIS